MSRRILLVAAEEEARARLAALARGEGWEVEQAHGARECLELCAERGPFDCVLADHDQGEGTGIELCARVHARWPDTARVLLAELGEPELAVRALHEGRILRLVRKPLRRDDVLDALRAAAEHCERAERERRMAEELCFSRDSLLQLLGSLEERLSNEVLALDGVRELALRLESALSLEDVARTAAEAVSRALGGRAAWVELAGGAQGPALSVAGGALAPRERRVVSALLASASLAAHGQLHRLERDEAQHATVFALARLAERRDNETGQHLERVSSYCRLIALGLRADGCYAEEITDRFVSDLVRSAPLHDIGKVGIPDEILLKPGKLDAREWEIMRSHTVIGGDTLRSIIESTSRPGFLRLGHDVALYHHERWNGGGYPFGLAGTAIPLGARILALADVYDALTTRRPYKAAWPHARALEHIVGERGKHFDPAVVDAFARRADEADRIRVLCPDEEPLESRV